MKLPRNPNWITSVFLACTADSQVRSFLKVGEQVGALTKSVFLVSTTHANR
jgi:hypothetical protein